MKRPMVQCQSHPDLQWLLHIPIKFAYGSQAVGDKICPFSDLIFEVALLQIEAGR
jgi:FKBP-type peptidyl-prolyl cis-trans isomerase